MANYRPPYIDKYTLPDENLLPFFWTLHLCSGSSDRGGEWRKHESVGKRRKKKVGLGEGEKNRSRNKNRR